MLKPPGAAGPAAVEDAAMAVIRRFEARRQPRSQASSVTASDSLDGVFGSLGGLDGGGGGDGDDDGDGNVKGVLGKWRRTAAEKQKLLHASDRDKWKGFVKHTAVDPMLAPHDGVYDVEEWASP
jgi:hypothetical protein